MSLRIRSFALPLLLLPGCPPLPAFVTCEEENACGTSQPSTTTGDPTPTTSDGVQTVTGDSADDGSTTQAAETTGSGDTMMAPPNEPPTVMLALSPASIDAAGVVQLSIDASDDVAEVDVVYRGQIVATLPSAAFPYDFEVTSQAKCDGDEVLTVVARDREGLVADDTKPLSCSLPASGSEAHKAQLLGTTLSMVHGVAILGDGFVAAGVLDGQLSVWRIGPDLQVLPGWPRVLADWTAIPGLTTLDSAAVGVTVDTDQNIIVTGNTVKAGIKTYYVAKLNAAGSRIAEAQGAPDEEAAGVTVTPDGLIVVAGAVRTTVQPPAYDWRVWGHAKLGQAPWADTLSLGPDEQPDLINERSERARAVVVLASGELLVVGEREYQKLKDAESRTRAAWQRYGSGGVRIGNPWTSDANGVSEWHDAANAVVVLPKDEFVVSGWARAKLGQPPQVWSRRFQDGEAQDFRIEQGPTAEAKGIGHDREHNLVVATTLTAAGQLDAWAFAFHGWALPAVWSQPPYGDPQGWDGYTSIACTAWGYCVTGGFLTVNGVVTGFLRLHNP